MCTLYKVFICVGRAFSHLVALWQVTGKKYKVKCYDSSVSLSIPIESQTKAPKHLVSRLLNCDFDS